MPDAALYGKDATPHIVAVHPLGRRFDPQPARMRVYSRPTQHDGISFEDVPFYPFFFLADLNLMQGFARERFRFSTLTGDNYFDHLVVFDDTKSYWDALTHVRERAGTQARTAREVYRPGQVAQQYLMQSGRTLFKGMGFDHLHRMQLDIEAYATAGFPQAERPDDQIITVALSDNRGWRKLLHLAPQITVPDGEAFAHESELLHALVEEIIAKDPDVIEGHNIYAFDFPYLLTRCARHGVRFNIGRHRLPVRSFPSSMRFAERTVEFPALEIPGRHVIDTFLLVMAFDVFKRDLPGYGLKAVARYFGFAPEGRTYIGGDDLHRTWRENPERLLAYALDDVLETERLARHLSGSAFYLTQMVPLPYGQVARLGPAAKIEALFVREYLRQRVALPQSEWGSQTLGGYTEVFFTGLAGPVVYADVESLYPSIMLNYDIRPERDALGIFQALLRRLTDLRMDTKAAMQAATSAEARGELDARQNSFKILINSFYGQLSFSLALFNDFSEADRVAATGQELLRQIIASIQQQGGHILEVDTDGVLFVPPEGVRGEAEERAFVSALNASMPKGIRIGFDGRFKRMLSYKAKNYALLTYDGVLKLKGSSLISRATERFGRRFVRRGIALLMEEDIEGLHALFLDTRDRILQHRWSGVDDFSRTETLKDNLAKYQADVAAGKRTRAAAYELAQARQAATGQPVRKGDRISYYITGTSAQVVAFASARLASTWDPDTPDENTAYYLKRLDEFARKFEPFFSDHHFKLIFSPEDLFGFSAKGITIRAHYLNQGDSTGPVPF